MFKRLIGLLVAISVTVVGAIPVYASRSASFLDVPENHWAYAVVEELYDKGVINGMPDGTFNPQGEVTAEQFIKMLVIATGKHTAKSDVPELFADVSDANWSQAYIYSAVQAGIVRTDEYEHGLFEPARPVDRGTVAVWIKRAVGITDTSAECFSDVHDSAVSESVVTLRALGITTGYEDGTYRPGNTLTRAESAAFIKRATDIIEQRFTPRSDSTQSVTFAENVVIASGDKEFNVLVDSDEKTSTLTFANADDTLKSLKPGMVLYMPPCDDFESGMLAKVESVKSAAGNTKLTVSEPSLEEVVRDVDLSLSVYPDESCFEGNDSLSVSGYDSGAVGAGSDDKEDKLLDYNAETESNWELGLDDEGILPKLTVDVSKTAKHELKLQGSMGNFSASCVGNIQVFTDVKITWNPLTQRFDSIDLAAIATTNVTNTISYGKKVSETVEHKYLPKFIPIAGPVGVTVTPSVVVSASGEMNLSASATLTTQSGFIFEDGIFSTVESNTELGSSVYADAEGSIKAGPKVTAEVGLCGNPFYKGYTLADISINAGASITGKTSVSQAITVGTDGIDYEDHRITPDENGVIHDCYLCVEGDLSVYADVACGLGDSLKGTLKGMVDKAPDDASKTFSAKIFDWHYSTGPWSTDTEFELCRCLHKKYRVTFNSVEHDTDKPLAGVAVIVGDESTDTGDSGTAVLYLKKGMHNAVTACKGYLDSTLTFPVYNSARDITLRLSPDIEQYRVVSVKKFGKKYHEYAEVSCYLQDEVVWTFKSAETSSFQFPTVSEAYANKGVVYFTGGAKLYALNHRTGEKLWELSDAPRYIYADEAILFDSNDDLHIIKNFASYMKVTKEGVKVSDINFGAIVVDYWTEGNILNIKYTDDTATGAGVYLAAVNMMSGTLISDTTLVYPSH